MGSWKASRAGMVGTSSEYSGILKPSPTVNQPPGDSSTNSFGSPRDRERPRLRSARDTCPRPLRASVSYAKPATLGVALGTAAGQCSHHREIATSPGGVSETGVQQRRL